MNTLQAWGYSPDEIRAMVGALRRATRSPRSGDATDGELALITMLVAAERLKTAGYSVRLRHVAVPRDRRPRVQRRNGPKRP
jgi:hypothetical protein